MAYSHQKTLHSVVNKIFGENIISNVRKEASFVNPSSSKYLEIDIWVPEKQICFEFQDSYHYVNTWYSHVSLDHVQDKDSVKYLLVRERGETLIIVPCWWDGEEASLTATIHQQRPEVPLRHQSDLPIPLNPPLKFFYEDKYVPTIGQLMLASMPGPNDDLYLRPSPSNAWWMGEKYDGVRCCCYDKNLYSRRGPEIYLLPCLTESLPLHTVFDGEIWFGRGLNLEAQRLIAHPENTPWHQLRIVAFDNASLNLRSAPFEDRYISLVQTIDTCHPFLMLAPRINCMNKRHIVNTTKHIIRDGGEGVIVRKYASPYIPGRSSLLYKLKALKGEQEALVVRLDRKYVLVRVPDGTTFPVPIDKKQFPSSEMPKKGDVVTITYDHYSYRTRPSNPRVLRKRKDVTWQNVMRDHGMAASVGRELTNRTILAFKARTPFNEGSYDAKVKQMRHTLEVYARNNHKDPLRPEMWYNLNLRDIQGVRYMCEKMQCTSVTLLMTLFPDIGLDEDKFRLRQKKYWYSEKNRRKFFDAFAKSQNFDPLVASNWYSVNWNIFYKLKTSASLLGYYGGSYRKALHHLYPNIGLDDEEFSRPPGFWKSKENRKAFLDRFAKIHSFDPLDASKWYKIASHQVSEKGGQTLLEAYYNGSLYKALTDLYPTMLLDNTLFVRNPRYHWREAQNTRAFLDKFAAEHQFDSLVAENWYQVSTLALKKAKGQGVLRYYSSLPRALAHIYPDVTFQLSKFKNLTKS